MIIRLHGDENGESHLSRLDLPSGRLHDIPTTTMRIIDSSERGPAHGYREVSRRQICIVLRGAFDVGTSDGDKQRIGPGDCLWEEDQGSKGHSFEDVGDELLMVILVGIADDYELPAQARAGA